MHVRFEASQSFTLILSLVCRGFIKVRVSLGSLFPRCVAPSSRALCSRGDLTFVCSSFSLQTVSRGSTTELRLFPGQEYIQVGVGVMRRWQRLFSCLCFTFVCKQRFVLNYFRCVFFVITVEINAFSNVVYFKICRELICFLTTICNYCLFFREILNKKFYLF